MIKPSDLFEQQIQRIHELLERFEAEVTWEAHIPDPDQPNRTQGRQVDVTIRRGDHLTLVECRLHDERQDVQWIEELMGRRVSLAADAVIAVSSSGFTSGAILKAARHGIATRDLTTLTDDEISRWGRSVELTLYCYQYSDVEIALLFESESLPKLDYRLLAREFAVYPGLQSMFNASATVLGSKLRPSPECVGTVADFAVRLQLDGFRLCGEEVRYVEFSGKAELVSQALNSPFVEGYGAPGEGALARSAIVARYSFGKASVVHDGERISTQIDLSKLELPPLRQFRFCEVRGDHEVEHEIFSIIGVEKLWVQRGPVSVIVGIVPDATA